MAAVLLFFGASVALDAAVLRGRLEVNGPNGRRPVAGIAVTVFRAGNGRSPPSFSGQDGMFYLNVPAGDYTLEVWYSHDPKIRPLTFRVKVREPGTDVPPIRLP